MNRIIKSFRKGMESLLGVKIIRTIPHGLELGYDIKALKPTYRLHSFFDIGANVGNTATKFASWFPESQIYCFEPISAAFDQLSLRMRNNPRAICYRLGFSSEAGSFQMTSKGTSTGNCIIKDGTAKPSVDKESVTISTLDKFTKENSVDRIGFLKIDTEGHDLKVLEGATELLDNKRVDFVQVECGISPTNQRHVQLSNLRDYLSDRGYVVFGFYDQTPEFSGNWSLRRVDAVFIRQTLATEHI
ncbi:MAG: FkbM family methyltransferase [Pirellula sp.]